MSYLGQALPYYDPTNAPVPQLDAERFNGNSSTTIFTMLRQVASSTDVDIFVDNVRQEPQTAYTVSNKTLTFSGAPSTGTGNIYLVYRNSYGAQNFATIPDGSISLAQIASNLKQFETQTLTGDGSTTAFTLSTAPSNANSIILSIDGVIQNSTANFSIAGAVITFTSAPANGAVIVAKHLGFRTGTQSYTLLAGSVGTTELADNSVTAAKIAPGTIIDSDLADDAVTTAKILDANVTTAKILDANVTTAKIADDAVTTAKILDANVTTAKILDANVTTAKILDANVTTAKIADDAVTTAKIASSVPLGTKNRIINGNMAINQRGSASYDITGAVYTLDRYRGGASIASKFSIAPGTTTPPAGFTNYLQVTSSAATTPGSTDNYSFFQRVEGYNVADLNWGTSDAQTVTVSFWVRSTLTGTFGGKLQNSAQNRIYIFSYTISSANTWEKKTITVTGDTTGTWLTTTGVGLAINFSVGAGSGAEATAGSWGTDNVPMQPTGSTNVVATSGATWQITGLQLEAGTTATDFENLQYGQQLALCQRYFERYNGAFDGGIPQGIALVDSANRPEINLFYLEKRANPTISGNTAVLFSTMANTELTTTGGPYSYVGTGPRGTNLFYNVASGVAPNTLSGVGYIKLSDATDYINIDAEL